MVEDANVGPEALIHVLGFSELVNWLGGWIAS